MSTVSSYDIGDLFEKASFQMMLLLFQKWELNSDVIRRQKSGTQHGYDIYFKVYDNNFLPIHIFVECKGSKDFDTIDKRELVVKNEQLGRNIFPVKDAHILLSPTLAIK